MRICLFFVATLTVLSLPSLAVEPGVDAGSFARFGVGAKALGMGGAFVALADDATAVYWNAAGLTNLKGLTFAGMYTNKFSQGIDYHFLSICYSKDIFSMGLSLIRQSITNIPFYDESEGGTFAEFQTLGLISFAISPQIVGMEGLSFGGNIKYYLHEILEGRGSGFGFDIGLLLRMDVGWGKLSMGVASRDVLGTHINWAGTAQEPSNTVPWVNTFGLGIFAFEDRLRFAMDVDIALGRPRLNRLHFGIEVWPARAFGIRAGFMQWFDGGGINYSIGASFGFKGFLLDYAFVPHSVLGPSHVFSVEFRWSD